MVFVVKTGPEYSKGFGRMDKIDEGKLTKGICREKVDGVRGRKMRWDEGAKELVEQRYLNFPETERQAKDKSEWKDYLW